MTAVQLQRHRPAPGGGRRRHRTDDRRASVDHGTGGTHRRHERDREHGRSGIDHVHSTEQTTSCVDEHHSGAFVWTALMRVMRPRITKSLVANVKPSPARMCCGPAYTQTPWSWLTPSLTMASIVARGPAPAGLPASPRRLMETTVAAVVCG